MLTIRTLGHVSIELETGPLHFETRTVAALLIYLACQRQPVGREALAEFFWPERPPKQARSNLRVALYRLRQQLADYLLITQSSVTLNPAATITLDIVHIERYLAEGNLSEGTERYTNNGHCSNANGCALASCLPINNSSTDKQKPVNLRLPPTPPNACSNSTRFMNPPTANSCVSLPNRVNAARHLPNMKPVATCSAANWLCCPMRRQPRWQSRFARGN